MKSNVLMMHILDVHTDYPFKNLFPINPTVLAAMTEDMKTHGFDMVHPIVVWGGHNGVVVDGHTRLQAAKDAGVLNVPLVIKEFADEDEAIQYAIGSQRNRRNLTDSELLNCIAAIDSRFPRGGSSKTAREVFGNSAQKTADILGISKTKVEKLRTVNDHASSQVKDAVLNGELSVNDHPVMSTPYNDRVNHIKAMCFHIFRHCSKYGGVDRKQIFKGIIRVHIEMVHHQNIAFHCFYSFGVF